MQTKKIVIAISAAMGLMLNGVVLGAELGKVQLDSGLDQPLSADIELTVPNAVELKHLHARMGERDAFHRAHLNFPPILNTVRFQLHSKADGSMVVHLSSDQPVTTPVLDMLIELDWGTGLTLQEYRLSLNPVGLNKGIQQASNSVVNGTVAGTVRLPVQVQRAPGTNAMPQNPTPLTQKSTLETNASATHTICIQKGMTLSGIAVQYLPKGIHLDQMLLALYQKNIQAFDGNMSRMQAGRTLRMPGQDDLAAINEHAAEHEVQIQAEAWDRYRQKLAIETKRSAARHSSSNEVHGHVVAMMPEKTVSPGQRLDELKLSHAVLPASAHRGKSFIQPQPTAIEKKRMVRDDMAARQNALKEEKIRKALLEENSRNIQKLLALKKQAMNENKPASLVVAATASPDTVSVSRSQSMTKWYKKINLSDVFAGGAVVLLLVWLKSIIHHRKKIEQKQKIYPE